MNNYNDKRKKKKTTLFRLLNIGCPQQDDLKLFFSEIQTKVPYGWEELKR